MGMSYRNWTRIALALSVAREQMTNALLIDGLKEREKIELETIRRELEDFTTNLNERIAWERRS